MLTRPNPTAVTARRSHALATLYIDAMNVIGSRPDGWWRDRGAAVRRLVDDLQPYAATTSDEVVLVVDGHGSDDLDEGAHGAVTVRYAGRTGRDAADDRIVELLEESDGHDVEVVTADRDLQERVRARGARVVGPRELRERLTAAGSGGDGRAGR